MEIYVTCLFCVIFLVCHHGLARKHKLELTNDSRNFFALSTFGFYKNGFLDVRLTDFHVDHLDENAAIGFSLDKTVSDAVNPYTDSNQEKCILNEAIMKDDESSAVIYFTIDFKSKRLIVNCSQHFQSVKIYPNSSFIQETRKKRHSIGYQLSDSTLFTQRRRKRSYLSDTALFASRRIKREQAFPVLTSEEDLVLDDSKKPTAGSAFVVQQKQTLGQTGETALESHIQHYLSVDTAAPDTAAAEVMTTQWKGSVKGKDACSKYQLPIFMKNINGREYLSANFVVYIASENEEGLYNLYFHNCANYGHRGHSHVNFTIEIVEDNNGNYLSAGEMPLPFLYFLMAVIFFLSGCIWVFILRKSKHEEVFKIHYLMGVLVFLKSFSLLFHGINFHFIQTEGYHIEAWAVLYYITHLLKGALLFITIVLIGTGWAFIKHILSEKDKKIFMVVIPLQVLANVAKIIMEESEEGEMEHTTWSEIFILVDLLCCGAILFPVVWSIRHLQEASQTDGKAAINLRKLELFRHFYIMIVCYIYFTRIIVYLLKITVPFQYEWMDEMFRETATYVFFILTGYKFRPASNNPYFTVPQEEDDTEMAEVITQSGLTEGITNLSRKHLKPKDVEEKSSQLSKRESSHEYD